MRLEPADWDDPDVARLTAAQQAPESSTQQQVLELTGQVRHRP